MRQAINKPLPPSTSTRTVYSEWIYTDIQGALFIPVSVGLYFTLIKIDIKKLLWNSNLFATAHAHASSISQTMHFLFS